MNTAVSTEKQHHHWDKKHLVHFLAPYENAFLKAILPKVPSQINTMHLTMMTLFWSSAVMAAGFLAEDNIQWLWLFNAAIFMQYVTDMLDGEVGRQRHTGLIKWGFYMDHFLDYVFLSSIVIGYSFMLPASHFIFAIVCLALTVGFMVHTMMDFSITHNFKISCNFFGVSEARCVLILFNILIIIFGRSLLIDVFPFWTALTALGLGLLVYNSQKTYRHLDVTLQAQKDEIFL